MKVEALYCVLRTEYQLLEAPDGSQKLAPGFLAFGVQRWDGCATTFTCRECMISALMPGLAQGLCLSGNHLSQDLELTHDATGRLCVLDMLNEAVLSGKRAD